MDKMMISLEPYIDLINKLEQLNDSMQFAREEISEEPLKQLCRDPNYRALAIEVYGEAQIVALEKIEKGENFSESMRRWSKNMNDFRQNELVIDTCKGPLQSVPALHLVYAFGGDLLLPLEDGTLTLKEGQTALFDLNVPHGVMKEADTPGIPVSLLLFKPYLTEMVGAKAHSNPLFNEFLSKTFYPGDRYRKHLVFNTENDSMMEYLFLLALSEYTHNPPFALDSVDCCVMQIMIQLMREYSASLDDATTHYPLNDKIKSILDYIDANLCDVTLSSAAKAFHFSPNHLSRIVKEQTGNTFIELVQKARLREATYYLRVQDMTVSQVANMVGYNNVSYFYKLFESKFYVSPNDYRNEYGLFSEKYRTNLIEK